MRTGLKSTPELPIPCKNMTVISELFIVADYIRPFRPSVMLQDHKARKTVKNSIYWY